MFCVTGSVHSYTMEDIFPSDKLLYHQIILSVTTTFSSWSLFALSINSHHCCPLDTITLLLIPVVKIQWHCRTNHSLLQSILWCISIISCAVSWNTGRTPNSSLLRKRYEHPPLSAVSGYFCHLSFSALWSIVLYCPCHNGTQLYE